MDLKQALEKAKQYIEKWRWIVEKYGFNIRITYCNSFDEMPEDVTSADTAGICYSSINYLDADIYFNVKKLSTLEDKTIEYAIVHELTHVLLSAMRVDNEELSATMLSRVLCDLAEK